MDITLPDGSVRQYDRSVCPADVAADIGPGLAKATIGAKVDGKLVDLDRPITEDAKIKLITRPKKNQPIAEQDPDALYLLRHSCAHVLAEAVVRLWPETLLAYGPPVENGFYYDLYLETPISSDDFEKIEAEMANIVAEDKPFTRYELPSDEGLAKLEAEGNKYKVDNARRALDGGAEVLSWYLTGADVETAGFDDLCLGPHLAGTAQIAAFKVMSIAASHWHGDVESDRFQRIYGTAFFSQRNLDEHLQMQAEARQRDHRILGQKLGLFALDEQVGQGLILWKPNGATVRIALQDFLQAEMIRRGYQMVFTPHIGKIDLYKTSGHYPFYSDSQFPPIQMRDSDEQYLLRPMNCPHHVKIYSSEKRSYRDLPVRLGEFGCVYRFEQSGELSGMARVRGFTQDDAHIFCTEDQVKAEFAATVELTQFVFNTFGFPDVSIYLSLRDQDSDKYVGDPANWDRAERELREVLDELKINYIERPGEAAFYGPKVDFLVKDVIGRSWQLGTVQLDYNLPQRFGLQYVGADNTLHQPVMIHRAPFGSMERFMAILIEHYNGAFPLWLSPEQVRVLPISDKFIDYGKQVLSALQAADLRVSIDTANERVNAKIKVAQDMKVNYMLVVGSRDAAAGTVSVRDRTRGDLGAIPLAAFVERAQAEVTSRGKESVTA
jgi:threonyl-tRNA synthetase